ncbi:MAG: helicase C-terminal domain-containing protein [Candidatus Pacearchaeota archaeon]
MEFNSFNKISLNNNNSQLKFNSDGSINLPESVERDLKEQKKKHRENTTKLLDIWDEDNLQDREKYNLDDDVSGFNLYVDGIKADELKFSNSKTQGDIVKEIISLISRGKKVIFIRGVCGTGKSAIALNLAKELGKSSIVVPGKALQKQYQEDYSKNKYVLKNNHEKLKIKVITGRDNHKCLYESDKTADYSLLPCKIEIKEANLEKLKEYLKENRRVSDDLELKNIKRISVAPICPYWSPIIPSEIDFPLRAEKRKYKGLKGIDFTIYNRKNGCKYYNQFNSYIDADAIVFNSAKYKLEFLMDRKPETEVEIIDECDEFLDSFSNVSKINLTRLSNTLINSILSDRKLKETLDKLYEIVSDLLENHKINENHIFETKETGIFSLLKYLLDNSSFLNELDEDNYCHHVYEVAVEFEDFLDDSFVRFVDSERGKITEIVTTNLSKKLEEMISKSKVVVMMSGTIHSEAILRSVFGVENFEVVDAEVVNQGEIRYIETGREIDCRYENFRNGNHSREDYLVALDVAVEKAPKPILIHVNSFSDLPNSEEISNFKLKYLISRDSLKDSQYSDFNQLQVSDFKKGKKERLFTTKCNRGVDFPGEQCRSIIFTKYPNPDVDNIFWKILKKTHPQWYWTFYKDKARREFLQKIYRGVRGKEDYVYVLSPDKRVIDAVKEMNKN